MRSLAEAIARCRRQLRYIPTATLRQLRVLALVNAATRAPLTAIHLQDPISRFVGGLLWPVPAARLALMNGDVGTTYAAIVPGNDLDEALWDARPGIAFAPPTEQFQASPLYRYVHQQLDVCHVAVLAYPVQADGCQVVVYPTRRHDGSPPFAPVELRALETVCAEFADVLSTLAPAGPYIPRPSNDTHHSVELDADLHPRRLPTFMEAMLAIFYGPWSPRADGHPSLPPRLVADLRRSREEFLRGAHPAGAEFTHAFTKNARGRVLCLSAHARPDGRVRLTLQEDISQYRRLIALKQACRALERDRTSIYSACLVIAEGVHDDTEIARRAGFAALAPASARRLVSRARQLVADTSR